MKFYGISPLGYGKKVLQTDDGGFLLLNSNLYASDENWLLKTDQNGDSLWKQTIDFGAPAGSFSIQPTDDGGYIITGQCYTVVFMPDVFLLKTDEFGNELWHQVYATGDSAATQGVDVLVTPDGGFLIVASYQYDPFNVESTFATWLLKTDDDGDSLWCRQFDEFVPRSALLTWDGNYVVTGFSATDGYDVWLMETDAEGEQLWSRTYHFGDSNVGYHVSETDNGGLVISGYCGDFYDAVHYCLLKTDSDGNEIWHQTFSEFEVNIGMCACSTIDGGIIVVGHTAPNLFTGNFDVMAIKTNGAGNELWRKIISPTENNTAGSILRTANGDYLISGAADERAMLVMLGGE